MAPHGVRSQPTLPAFVSPMLAQKGEPFDSGEHLFEIKWDGTRMLAFVERDGYRLVSERRRRSPRGLLPSVCPTRLRCLARFVYVLR